MSKKSSVADVRDKFMYITQGANMVLMGLLNVSMFKQMNKEKYEQEDKTESLEIMVKDAWDIAELMWNEKQKRVRIIIENEGYDYEDYKENTRNQGVFI